jgi:hypothetical protein
MAALISLKTNLKSLRYGQDRIDGGSSNQPYISTPIPQTTSRTGGIDFLLRGGTLTPLRVGRDVSRLTKMFRDFKSPNGVLFTAKQNLLSRTGVKTQASGFINEGAYLPTSTILQAGGNAFGTHLLKQGTNPFRNTSPNIEVINNPLFNLLGVASNIQNTINSAGGLPVYAQIVKSNQSEDDNRLVLLKKNKIKSNTLNSIGGLFGSSKSFKDILGENNSFKSKLSSTIQTIFTNSTKNGISSFDGEILRYGGGPGSVLGVGQTAIKRYTTSVTKGFNNGDEGNGSFIVLDSDSISGKESSKLNITVSDFRKDILKQQDNNLKKNILSNSLDYSESNKRIEGRVNLGDPGKRNKNVSSYSLGLLNQDGKPFGPLDKINAYPLYKSSSPDPITKPNGDSSFTNDLVQFRIGIISNDSPKINEISNNSPGGKTYMHFRAFLDSMDDNYAAEWNGFKYMGRGENFYRYNGFTRTINLGWTVAAQSKEELIPMYKKLNFLASSLAPDYSSNGYMRGNLATLTVGGYLYEQPGIITSINYSVPTESPWEIGIDDKGNKDDSVKELPHIIRVTGFQFIPIHTFAPKIQQNKFGTGTVDSTSGNIFEPDITYGKEKYIALSNEGTTDNYTPESIRGNAKVGNPTRISF